MEKKNGKSGIEEIKEKLLKGKEKIGEIRGRRRERRYEKGEVDLPVFRVGPNKKGIAVLWLLMGASLAFGVYKNFTAIDKETVYETTVVEASVVDTNAVESFVENFAYLYHAWDGGYDAKATRETALVRYMTDELAKVNSGAVNSDCPTKAQVERVRICGVKALENGDYEVRYCVVQCFTESGESETASLARKELPVVAAGTDGIPADVFEGTQTQETAEDLAPENGTSGEQDGAGTKQEETESIPGTDAAGQTPPVHVEVVRDDNGTVITRRETCYIVRVHLDESGGLVIVRNPTVCGWPEKSAYTPAAHQSDGSVDAYTMDEIEGFLNTFFALYPQASENELAYYAKAGTMDEIDADYVYGGLLNPVYYREEGRTMVHVYVRYLDQDAKMTQISEYSLTLEKGDNWKIVEAE